MISKHTRKIFIKLAHKYETTGIEDIRKESNNCIGKYGIVFGNVVAESLTGFGGSNCLICKAFKKDCQLCWHAINGHICWKGPNKDTFEAIAESSTPMNIRKAFIARAKHIRSELKRAEEKK